MYELCRGRLHVGGERQAVAADTVAAAVALYRAESKEFLDPACEERLPIPEDLAHLILRMEARKAVRGLREELLPILAA
jgi:hypothetical protein